jgi:hypothetical protein
MRAPAGTVLLIAVTLAACASTPKPQTQPLRDPGSAQRRQVYQAAFAHAGRLDHEDRLREALWWLKVANTVADDSEDLRPALAQLEARIAAEIDARLAEGDRARKGHSEVQASLAYRQVLALDPANAHARQALREIETAAMLRAIAHGGGGGPPASRPSGTN